MILIEPNNIHDLRTMRDWCEDQFGSVRGREVSVKRWGIIQPEFVFMFREESWATAFMLKFGGKVYDVQG